jgi:nucleoside-diphosphate-sugar epimerase
MSAEGGSLELSVINPGGIFGPILGPDFSSSIDLVTRLMQGMPGCPRLYFGVVDVRDVADLHVRAMTHPAAKGERFIATSGPGGAVRSQPEDLGTAARQHASCNERKGRAYARVATALTGGRNRGDGREPDQVRDRGGQGMR